MTARPHHFPVNAGIRSPWAHVAQVAAALAASMGVGRFVYTPILPLMTAQAGLTAAAGASLATANTSDTSSARWPEPSRRAWSAPVPSTTVRSHCSSPRSPGCR